jgi:hypothetical protein
MTTSKSKAKGTSGEREALNLLRVLFPNLRRTPASSRVDLLQWADQEEGSGVNILALRVDRGQWLFTLDFLSLANLVGDAMPGTNVRVEVKRYKKAALNTIWEDKFGGDLGR